MPCYSPLVAYKDKLGTVRFDSKGGSARNLILPCGRCLGCRLEHSRQWATRIVHETKFHQASEFITLTYGPGCAPSLHYPDFQLFLKRLRKRFGKIRFFVAGEYGSQNDRPHWHAIIFGLEFPDRTIFKITPRGHKIYRSAILEQLWPHGFSSTAEVNFETAQYVAKYTTKKVTGDLANSHYKRIDPETGEIFQLKPEFARMSLKPGIGGLWFETFHQDVLVGDHVISNGVPTKPPRYYDKLAKRLHPDQWEANYANRTDQPVNPNSNFDRLSVRESVRRSALKLTSSERGDFLNET